MKIFDKTISAYSRIIAKFPYIVILLVILLTIFLAKMASTVETESMDYDNMLPEGEEVMRAFNILEDKFGGDSSIKISLEIDPKVIGSNEPRDIRDPRVMRYMYVLGEATERVEGLEPATSAATLLYSMNSNHIPGDIETIIEQTADNPSFSQYISKDYTMAVISFKVQDDADEFEVVKYMQEVVDEIPKQSGLDVQLAGALASDVVVQEEIGPSMAVTSRYSLIGILIVLLLLFGSIKYGLTPLTTIGIGVVWAMGYVALRGMGMTSATSGVISMIMGIGIDFGIQTVSRFRQELRTGCTPEIAIQNTMANVVEPMATTTIAALIGFKAMSMGNLTFLAEMGTMMSYGITACFLVAITLVPALLVVLEKLSFRKKSDKKTKKDCETKHKKTKNKTAPTRKNKTIRRKTK